MVPQVIAIGTSLGGLNALTTLFSCLPASFPVPIAVVMHRAAAEFDYLINVLQKSTDIEIIEARDKMPISANEIVIAPADYHLMIDLNHYALSVDEPVQYARPSIDVFFESVADQYADGAVGVLLTGGGCDGISGLRKIKSRGGTVFVQSPSTAEDPDLPRAALDAGIVTDTFPVNRIASRLIGLGNAVSV